jgi:hypothetical protein
MAMNGANVRLQIDELALHGFSPGDGPTIAAALQDQLAALLRTEGIPASLHQGAHMAMVPGGDIGATASSDPVVAGHEIAQAIFSSLQEATQ